MKFIEKVNQLQKAKENQGYIIFVRCGIFYTAIGKDAVAIMKRSNYKPVCAKERVCKIGIPISSFEKYLRKLIEENVGVVVYDYQKESEEYKEIARVAGIKEEEINECLECEKCWYKKNRTINTIEDSIKVIENLQRDIEIKKGNKKHE